MRRKEIEKRLKALEREEFILEANLKECQEYLDDNSIDRLKEEVDTRKRLQEIQKKRAYYEGKLAEKKLTTYGGVAAASTLILVITLASVLNKKDATKNVASEVNSSNKSDKVIEIVVPTPNLTAVPTAVPSPTPMKINVSSTPTVEPTSTPEPIYVEEVTVPYGFTDIDDLEVLTENIFVSYIEPMLEDLNIPVQDNTFERIELEDMIRILNGELPVYEDYNENSVVNSINKLNNVFANKGVGNKLYPFNYSMFFEEDSYEAKFVKSYDDIYNKIAEYREEGNADGVVEQIGLLGNKLYNEIILDGLYGGYSFSDVDIEKRYFVLQSVTSRFSNYVREWLESNDETVCVPGCYDIDSNEIRLFEVRDIVEALYRGTSINGEVSVMRGNEIVNLFAESFEDLNNILRDKDNIIVYLR